MNQSDTGVQRLDGIYLALKLCYRLVPLLPAPTSS